MSRPRSVVVTGVGTVNALGTNVSETWAAMRTGRSAIGPLPPMPDRERLDIRIGAAVTADLDSMFRPSEAAWLDRVTRLARIAAAEASADGETDPERTGIVLGTAAGGIGTWDAAYRAVLVDRRDRVHPFTVPRLMASAPVSAVAAALGLCGPALSVGSACAASTQAVVLGAQMIRAGAADAMLVGGTEAMLCFGGIKAWEALRVLSQTGCRPFCATRDGMVLGEGAAVLRIEAEDHARARGARVLARIAGTAMATEASDWLRPSPEGVRRAMRLALEDAGATARDIGHLCAHGTGTRANDEVEAAAIRDVLGGVPVSATKSLHGHAIGASGAIELVGALMALSTGHRPVTAVVEAPMPDLDLVTAPTRTGPVGAVMANALAFGGLNAAIVLAAP